MTKLLSSAKVQKGIVAAEIIFALVLMIYVLAKDWSNIKSFALFTISIDCTCLIINIIFFISIIGQKEDFNVNFITICVADFIALMGECAAWATENNPRSVSWAWASNIVLYVGGILLVVSFYYLSCSMSGDKRNERSIWRKIVNILALIAFFVLFINLFTGMVFRIDPVTGEYIKGNLYTVFFVIPYMIWGMAGARIIASRQDKKRKILIITLLLIPAAVNVASTTFFEVGLTYSTSLVSIGVVYIMYYKSLESENSSISRSFGRFLSDEVVNKLAGSKHGEPIKSKYFRASILISDIRDFTRISEGMNSEQLMSMMNHYYSVMMEIVVSFGGITIEFMGDGLKVVFGAPNRRTDHAEVALMCAAQMQNAMGRINSWNVTQGYPEIEMGIGVHTGNMIFGSIGNINRTRYSAVGVEVSMCQFIEEQTFGGQVLLSEDTLNEITLPVDVKFIDVFEYNDLERGVNIYLLNSIDDMSLSYDKEILDELESPVFIDFYVSTTKRYDSRSVKGRILSVSKNEAMLQSEKPLAKHLTMTFKIDRENYNARIVKKISDDNRYLIHFTGNLEKIKQKGESAY